MIIKLDNARILATKENVTIFELTQAANLLGLELHFQLVERNPIRKTINETIDYMKKYNSIRVRWPWILKTVFMIQNMFILKKILNWFLCGMEEILWIFIISNLNVLIVLLFDHNIKEFDDPINFVKNTIEQHIEEIKSQIGE